MRNSVRQQKPLKSGHNMRTLTKRWRLALAAIGLTLVMALLTNCSQKTSGTPGLNSQSTAGAGHGGGALHVVDRPGNVFPVEDSGKTSVIYCQNILQLLRGFSWDHT